MWSLALHRIEHGPRRTTLATVAKTKRYRIFLNKHFFKVTGFTGFQLERGTTGEFPLTIAFLPADRIRCPHLRSFCRELQSGRTMAYPDKITTKTPNYNQFNNKFVLSVGNAQNIETLARNKASY